MRTMEVIDHIQLSRYHRTNANANGNDDGANDADAEGGGAGAAGRNRRGGMGDLVLAASGSGEEGGGDGGAGGGEDDDLSFAGSDLEHDLERELARRSMRRRAKQCAAAFVVGFVLVAVVGKGHPLSLVGGRHRPYRPQKGPGGGDGDDDGYVDDEFPITATMDDDYLIDEVIESVEEGAEEIQDLVALFNAKQALPPYEICPPPRIPDRPATQADSAVFHASQFRIVPEDDPSAAEHERWEYTLSDMDVNKDASIVALGMGDYAADTGYAVGMVRAFAYSCADRAWKRLGQDLLGERELEMFGHRVSSSGDGRVLAVSAPQGSLAGARGFVDVYLLDDAKTGRWEPLGSRIDALDGAESEYYMLGHAVDLSDRGETLAVLAIVDDEDENPSYVTRVFDYDYRKEEWLRKGHDLVIANVTYGRDYEYDYSPQVSLSDKGDKLIVTDPQMGVVKYHFHFGLNHWKREESRTPKWNTDEDEEYWISSLDLDDTGDLVAFSAWEEVAEDGEEKIVNAVKVVDFQADASDPVDVYARDFRGWEVGLSVAVSADGRVAAFVASVDDEDDANWWSEYVYDDYGYDIVGALTVVTKYEGEEAWSIVGEGTDAESLGVSGSQVSLSGDGQIAAVGYDTVVSLYGISLNKPIPVTPATNPGKSGEVDTAASVPEQENVENDEDKTTQPTLSNICPPFPNATSPGGVLIALGSIYDLPQAKDGEEQHTLSLALSEDASIVAVGIDSYDGEDRGLVRTFAWSCEEGRYLRLGQDLLGSHEFDGFGQSVDLSADGRSLAVGANQPPPGKPGYVDVYKLQGVEEWQRTGDRIKNFPEGVSDIGREVHLSNDGRTVMILGSIMSDNYDSSYVVVKEKKNGKWATVGSDIRSSIEYDDSGTSAHATLSGNGSTIAVTGSYSQFLAKLYDFDRETSNWAETVIPPLRSCASEDAASAYEDDDLDYLFECYFSGESIAINSAGNSLAVAGSSYDDSGGEIAMVKVLHKDNATGNYSIGEPLDITTDYYISSVDISDDGQHLAVGINDHSDNLEGQGVGLSYVATDTGEWIGIGKVDGTDATDFLGARVRIANNGRLAAASSRRGYISFFGANST